MPGRISHIAVHNEAGALRYNGFKRLNPNDRAVQSSHLYCEPQSVFECTDTCATKVACRALVMEKQFSTAFSPFMMDLARRMRTFGWHVFNTEELTTRAQCIPDLLVFYIPQPAGYDAAVRWRNRMLANESGTSGRLAEATWLLLMEDVGDTATNYVLRKAGTWFDGIFARYPASTISQLVFHNHVTPRRRILSFPHAASRDFLLPLVFEAKNDSVLLSGEVGQDYPLRVAARALNRQGVVRRRTVTTRTGDFSDPQQQARSYAKEISRFHIAIAGCRQYHSFLWLVAKHFEIMAAGTAMLTDVDAADYLQPLGLWPGWHYLESTPLRLNETLQYWLAPSQRNALRAITERGHRAVKAFHMGEARAHSLDQLASAVWASKNSVSKCSSCQNRVDDGAPGATCGEAHGGGKRALGFLDT